jgi:GH18 family chitinase
LIAKAQAAGVKTIAMLGGAGDGGGWVASTANSSVRSTFINNILDMCVAKDYDGVDVDWEERLDTVGEQNQLITFLTELRAAAATRPRYQSPNDPFLILFPGYALNLNFPDVPAWNVTVASLVDQYNLMSYSQNWEGSGWDSWFFSALKGHGPSYPSALEGSIQAYVDAGVPRSKLGIGIGLYGNYYFSPITGPRQGPTGGKMGGGNDNFDTYANFHEKGLFNHPNGTYVWDDQAETGYYTYSPPAQYQKASWADVESITMLTTEDLQSIAAKGTWTRAGNCGGTIIWAINYGYVNTTVGNPPMDTIKTSFLEGGSPPDTTPPAAPTGLHVR